MFRPSAARHVVRSLNAAQPAAFRTQRASKVLRSQLCTLSRRPQTAAMNKSLASQLLRAHFADSRGPPMDKIDAKHEKDISKQKLEQHPEYVSESSSVHPVLGEVGVQESGERETEMLAGVKHDLKTIRDTFSLAEVPSQAYYIGMAGVLPYVATSLSTIYCAWEINHTTATGTGFLMDGKTAELALHILEPLQVGYGATILSFLGAVHWGLEFAKYGGVHGYSRYGIGVMSTALAWPTILMPVEYALISQFLIFNFLYYNDSRATKAGWAPPWYAVYRFVLTFIVGASIVASLVGRGQIAGQIGRSSGPAQRIQDLRDHQASESVNEEEARRKYLASKDEGDDEDEEEGEEDGGEEDGDNEDGDDEDKKE